jgi:hypothetical protein
VLSLEVLVFRVRAEKEIVTGNRAGFVEACCIEGSASPPLSWSVERVASLGALKLRCEEVSDT